VPDLVGVENWRLTCQRHNGLAGQSFGAPVP
jgi:hypothetical protein